MYLTICLCQTFMPRRHHRKFCSVLNSSNCIIVFEIYNIYLCNSLYIFIVTFFVIKTIFPKSRHEKEKFDNIILFFNYRNDGAGMRILQNFERNPSYDDDIQHSPSNILNILFPNRHRQRNPSARLKERLEI